VVFAATPESRTAVTTLKVFGAMVVPDTDELIMSRKEAVLGDGAAMDSIGGRRISFGGERKL
jgi:hypothetical protein